ncbi:hypothetical protein C8J57DRAFT_1432279 [Mycena rebaudengoi]|nr:hypothetical protein C8J57DRAFT_1432279 [Mycena rebaudengoi]
MRRTFDNVTNQLAQSQAEVAKLEERCQALEKALKGTREMLHARERELERIRKAGHVPDDEIHEAGRTRARAGESSRDISEQRAQLRSTELFMTKTDSWSGAQIVQAVHDLNSEIIQLAASATELCTFDPSTPSSGQAIHDTSARLGSNLVDLLTARDHSQDPTLVALALQAGMSTCIARAMSSFCLGLPSKSDITLSQIYSHIFVAGRVESQ